MNYRKPKSATCKCPYKCTCKWVYGTLGIELEKKFVLFQKFMNELK